MAERNGRVRRSTVAHALGAALVISVFLPTAAVGDPVGEVLGGLGVGAGTGGGNVVNHGDSPEGAGNRAGTPPNYQPPLHGTNAHGEGTVAAVDLNPSNTNPYPSGPQGGNEEIVVGDSRGESTGGAYHGRVTLIYVNPLGIPIANIFIDTNPGESRNGPPAPLDAIAQANAGPLQQLCTQSSGNVCMAILPMNSSTTSTDSSNLFALFRGSFMQGQTTLNLGTSSGQIQEGGGCQTASGTSSIANGTVAGLGNLDVFSASSSSTACNNGAQSTQNSSTFLNLFGFTPPIPGLPGCGNLIANSSLSLGPLGGLVCHADDVNGGQTSNPYGVREAFAAVLAVPPVRIAVSGPESHAIAPLAPPTPQRTPRRQDGPDAGSPGGVAGAVAASVLEGRDGGLPVTGENVLLLGLIGTGLVGLGLMGAAAGRRRTA